MNVFLIRHGETTGDVEDRYGGDYDDHLTDRGRAQSLELAQNLIGRGIEAIFTSPRFRARETAEILGQTLGIQPEVAEGFRERNHYGVMTGMTKAEARGKYPELVDLLKDTHNTIPGGESYDDFRRRITEVLGEVSRRNFKTIAVVTHGGPIRLVFREILKRGEINIRDCAYAEIEIMSGNITLLSSEGIE